MLLVHLRTRLVLMRTHSMLLHDSSRWLLPIWFIIIIHQPSWLVISDNHYSSLIWAIISAAVDRILAAAVSILTNWCSRNLHWTLIAIHRENQLLHNCIIIWSWNEWRFLDTNDTLASDASCLWGHLAGIRRWFASRGIRYCLRWGMVFQFDSSDCQILHQCCRRWCQMKTRALVIETDKITWWGKTRARYLEALMVEIKGAPGEVGGKRVAPHARYLEALMVFFVQYQVLCRNKEFARHL